MTSKRLSRRISPLASAVMLMCLCAGGAWGHGVELFALVDGTQITGNFRYPDGTPIADARIRAFDPNGALLAEATTDAEGHFALPVTRHCDHELIGDAGEGHRGAFTVAASELPLEPAAEVGETGSGAAAPADLDARIERAVARQVAPLRQQLFDYEHAIRLRDLVGGIGYVFGVAGIVVLVNHRGKRPES